MTNLPIEILSHNRVHLRFLEAPEAHWYYEADEDEISITKAMHIHEAFDPDDETKTTTHILFRYPCSDGRIRWLCLPFDNEPDITAEDLAEWEASSAGCDYYYHRSGR